MTRSAFAAALAAILLPGSPARAWDLFGHHVVGAVAWEHLDPGARKAVAELLQKAPPDSDLAERPAPSDA